ncbi:MAG TPA: hypothetical protein VHY58_04455 [Streptosporangiaceae bacterium]|nr:hypothetical protein [Streptosporangiaceae bacterium]
MTGAELTDLYLAELSRRNLGAAELLGDLPGTELLNAFQPPGRKYLCRPMFLAEPERDQLYRDVETVRAALVSLPDRLYDGDFAAFARAVGAGDIYVTELMRDRTSPTSRQARADLYRDESGFQLMELNLGSALGGMENADMCRALLKHPVLMDFARAHGLGYIDTMREQVHDLLTESGYEPGSCPVVAVTDWPSSYERKLGPYMGLLARRWRELGLDAHACHLGQLQVRNGRVWLDGRPVDIVARMFMIEYLLESAEAPGLFAPIMDAAARGEVKIFAPLDSDLFTSKGGMAMLSEHRNRHLFTGSELASIDRIVPWTREVRPGPVSLADGTETDLLGYAIANQHELVLKPNMLHGGEGVVLGWHPSTSPRMWRDQLDHALGGDHVIQRRIRPEPELLPDDNGDLVPWNAVWGVFTVVRGYGGTYIRAARCDSDMTVINRGRGAFAGCCLSAGLGLG